MFRKLNGWQRLWVVISIILLMVFSFYAYDIISHDQINEGKCASEFNVRWTQSHLDETKGINSQPDIFDRVGDREYESCIKKEQIKVIAKTIMFWIIAITLIYGAGFSVSWVKSGFINNGI